MTVTCRQPNDKNQISPLTDIKFAIRRFNAEINFKVVELNQIFRFVKW